MPDSAQFRPPSSRSRYDGWSLDERNPDYINSIMLLWEWFYRYYFRVQTAGWHHIPSEGKFLIVGSHNGGLPAPDMHMCLYDWFRRFGTERLLYGLMHPNVWKAAPSVARQAAQCGAVIAHPKMAIAAFKRNASVAVYPGGAEDVFRPHSMRNQIYFAGRKGFIKLALREEVPIIPVISWGAHDTLFVLGDFYQLVQQLHQWGMPWLLDIDPEVFPIYLGLPWGISVGPLPNFPLPAQIHTQVCAPIHFERYGRQAALDRDYVDHCYERVQTQMQHELDGLIASVETSNRWLGLS
ncbi:MAG: lysophospholipid acyltransferase family protein [Cyanobacteria bacterium J06592_8]